MILLSECLILIIAFLGLSPRHCKAAENSCAALISKSISISEGAEDSNRNLSGGKFRQEKEAQIRRERLPTYIFDFDKDTDPSAMRLRTFAKNIALSLGKKNPSVEFKAIESTLVESLKKVTRALYNIEQHSRNQSTKFEIKYFADSDALYVKVRETDIRFDLSLYPISYGEAKHSSGEYYQTEIPRAFRDLREFQNTFNRSVDNFISKVVPFLNQIAFSGWSIGPAPEPVQSGGRHQSQASFPTLSGVHLKIENPNDTVRVYRGSARLADLNQSNQLYMEGDVAKLTDISSVTNFIHSSLFERLKIVKSHIVSRKGGNIMGSLPMGGGRSFLVGVTESFSEASFHGGGYVAAMEIPRELLFNPDVFYTDHQGESELMVLFGIHPSWIVKIYGPNETPF